MRRRLPFILRNVTILQLPVLAVVRIDVQQPIKQSTTQNPSQPPAAYIVDAAQVGAPRTAQDVRALRLRLDDLREQLQDAASRRRTVSEQLPGADPAARPGLAARMGELDTRILRIEKDISETQRLLTSAPNFAYVQGSGRLPNDILNRVGNDVVPIVAILSVFVLGPFAVAMSRWIWKRSSAPPPRSAAIDSAAQQRLEQLQQSMDTIAIEIERISEGQRFVTKLLGDRAPQSAALPVGAAEPVGASQKQQSAVREGR